MLTIPSLLSSLIANPVKLLEQGQISRDAPRLLAIGALAAAAVGAAAGSQHEGPQWLYAALKMPLVFLVPPLFIVPALRAAAASLQMALDPRRTLLAALATSARAAVFGAALSPLLWLFSSWDGRYRVSVLLMLAVLAVAGWTGVTVLRGLVATIPLARRSLWIVFAAGLFALVAGQTGWHLSPFVLRPNLPVTFLAPPRGDVVSTLRMRLNGPPRRLMREVRLQNMERQRSPAAPVEANSTVPPEGLKSVGDGASAEDLEQLKVLGYVDNTVQQ